MSHRSTDRRNPSEGAPHDEESHCVCGRPVTGTFRVISRDQARRVLEEIERERNFGGGPCDDLQRAIA